MKWIFYFFTGVFLILTGCNSGSDNLPEISFRTVLTDTLTFSSDTLNINEEDLWIYSNTLNQAQNAILDSYFESITELELTALTVSFEMFPLISNNQARLETSFYLAQRDSTISGSIPAGTIENLVLQGEEVQVTDETFDQLQFIPIIRRNRIFRYFLSSRIINPPLGGELILKMYFEGKATPIIE
jgi:hypothetical protein